MTLSLIGWNVPWLDKQTFYIMPLFWKRSTDVLWPTSCRSIPEAGSPVWSLNCSVSFLSIRIPHGFRAHVLCDASQSSCCQHVETNEGPVMTFSHQVPSSATEQVQLLTRESNPQFQAMSIQLMASWVADVTHCEEGCILPCALFVGLHAESPKVQVPWNNSSPWIGRQDSAMANAMTYQDWHWQKNWQFLMCH